MRYGSLCSGIGGLDRAVETVWPDASPAWMCEAEPDAVRVLERWWPATPVLPDVRTQDWSTVEPVELLCAGYPCQPFSTAGRRGGRDDPRHLWPAVADAVRVLRPRLVLLENVAGHLGLGFDAVLADLAEAGFDAEWTLVRASDVGAPHRRERLFVLAHDAEGDGGRVVHGERGGAAPDPDRPRREGDHLAGGRDEPPGRGRAPADPDRVGGDRPVVAWRRGSGPPDGGRGAGAPPDAAGAGLEGATGPLVPVRRGGPPWGDYEPAIRRWERVLGRAAPDPVDGHGRLSVPFVEWMQGFDEGWVTGLVLQDADPRPAHLSRAAALRCLGNAVVQQQGAHAILELLAAG